MSKISEIRRIIRSFNGKKFNTSQVRKAADMYVATGQRLDDLVVTGEIEKLELVRTSGRSTREWREIKINIDLMDVVDIKPQKAKSADPWSIVYPEFFRDPMIPCTVRRYQFTIE